MIVLSKICVFLSYLTMGLYFVQMVLLSLFPEYEHLKDVPYSEDMDISFFVVIPCLNEENVIGESVRHMFKTGMKRLRVIVVDDDSDDASVELLKKRFPDELESGALSLICKKAPDARKGKGHSLNVAYSHIAETIEREGLDPARCVMTVFDADAFIGRKAFERVAVMMDKDPTVGMVQTRVRIGTYTRDFFLPRMQDIEFFMYINRMQNLREYTGTVAAAGNGQFNRFSAIDPETPWTQCLLEDFDFSTRLLLKGWRTRLLQSSCVYQQGVQDYRSFLKQRTRWCQGGLQCFRYLDDIWRSKYVKKAGAIEMTSFMLLACMTVVAILSTLCALIVIVYYTWTRGNILPELMAPYPVWELAAVFVLILFLAWTPGIIYGVWYYTDTRENFFCCILSGLFQPVYNYMLIPAVISAVWRQLNGVTLWEKTKHK